MGNWEHMSAQRYTNNSYREGGRVRDERTEGEKEEG